MLCLHWSDISQPTQVSVPQSVQCPEKFSLRTGQIGCSTGSLLQVSWEGNVQTLCQQRSILQLHVLVRAVPTLTYYSTGKVLKNMLLACGQLPHLIFNNQSKGMESVRNLFTYQVNLEPDLRDTEHYAMILFSGI